MPTEPSVTDVKSTQPISFMKREYQHNSDGKEFSWMTSTPTSDQLHRAVSTLIRTLQTKSDFPIEYTNCLIQFNFHSETKEVKAQAFCQQPNAVILSMLTTQKAKDAAGREWANGRYTTLLIFTSIDKVVATTATATAAAAVVASPPRKFLFQSSSAAVTIHLHGSSTTVAAAAAAPVPVDKKGTYTVVKVVPGSELIKRADIQHTLTATARSHC